MQYCLKERVRDGEVSCPFTTRGRAHTSTVPRTPHTVLPSITAITMAQAGEILPDRWLRADDISLTTGYAGEVGAVVKKGYAFLYPRQKKGGRDEPETETSKREPF